MIASPQKAKILAVIHLARAVLILSLFIVVFLYHLYLLQLYSQLQVQYGSLGLIILVLILEFYDAAQLYTKQMIHTFQLGGTVILVIIVDLFVLVSKGLLGDFMLALHIGFLLSLSVVEFGVLFMYD